MRSVTAYYILIAGCALCSGQDAAMLKPIRLLFKPSAGADRAALDHLLDADFTWTDFDGKTQTKADV